MHRARDSPINEVTYKMSIPEAELIKYAAEHSFIKEETEND